MALSDPQLSNPAKMRKKCCYGQKNFGSICSSLSPSHTQPTSTLSRIKCERYIFIKKCFRSLKFVIVFDYVPHIFVYVSGYTTLRGSFYFGGFCLGYLFISHKESLSFIDYAPHPP